MGNSQWEEKTLSQSIIAVISWRRRRRLLYYISPYGVVYSRLDFYTLGVVGVGEIESTD